MSASQTIRTALERVSALRRHCDQQADGVEAMHQVKRIQSARFAASYADLTPSQQLGPVVRFFLQELYGDHDFSQRDTQFARIAGAIQRFFPAEVVATAQDLARLHELTEDLDQAMAQAWLAVPEVGAIGVGQRYVNAWRQVGQEVQRRSQLQQVLRLGHEVAQLTRVPGLRLALRLMRAPAAAAGLGDLQRFLEIGFDRFANLALEAGQAEQFLSTIEQRESAWLQALFHGDAVTCATTLEQALGQVR